MPDGEVFDRGSLALGGNIVSPEVENIIKTTMGIYPVTCI